jgi:HAD superfamily hydrolase (TIGR01509 family)
VFDAGDVLYDATAWRRWLLRLLGRIGLHTNYRAFFYLWDRDYLHEVCRGRRDFCEAFEAFLLAVGFSRAQIDEIEAACQAKRNHWEANARPLPGVKTTLGRLRAAGLPLGVLSDCEYPGAVLGERLERFGLGGLFQAVISSLDIERTKPDPLTYLTVLRALGVEPEDSAFVGHDTDELAGAAAVGMQTVAFNFDPDARADVFIGRFEELLDVVRVRGLRAAG